jgi:hypothetical protein
MKKIMLIAWLFLLLSLMVRPRSLAAITRQQHKPAKVKPHPRKRLPVKSHRMHKQLAQAKHHEARNVRAEEAQRKAAKAHKAKH